MQIEVTQNPLAEVDADARLVAVFDGEDLPAAIASAPGADELRTSFKRTTVLRPEGAGRWIAVGLGSRDDVDAERLRVAAAAGVRAAAGVQSRSVAWDVPEGGDGVARNAAPSSRGPRSPPTPSTASAVPATTRTTPRASPR